MRARGALSARWLAALALAVAAGAAEPVVGAARQAPRPQYRGFASERRLSRTHAAIIQGIYAKQNALPYQVYLRVFLKNGTVDFCGGAIISHRHILTAAHCVKKPNLLKELVVVGSINRFSKNALIFTVVKQTFYEVSKKESVEADIAVLMVDRVMPLGMNNVKTVKLQSTRELNRKIICTVAGWGESRDKSDPDLLKVIKVPLVRQKDCEIAYPNDPPRDLICAGFYKTGGIDTCQGDSGSPLVCAGKLTGIVKGGVGCGLPGYPGTYTDVSYYRTWIKKIMANDLRQEAQEKSKRPKARSYRSGFRRQYTWGGPTWQYGW